MGGNLHGSLYTVVIGLALVLLDAPMSGGALTMSGALWMAYFLGDQIPR